MKKTTLRQDVNNTDRKWYVVDAEGQTLGTVATKAAEILSGKDRADYTPHVDGGDYVVILNTEKVVVTGQKEVQKMYYQHSGHLGNLKKTSLKEIRRKNPKRILREAVSGMLPKNKLRAARLKRLMLVMGSENPHQAQNPETLNLS